MFMVINVSETQPWAENMNDFNLPNSHSQLHFAQVPRERDNNTDCDLHINPQSVYNDNLNVKKYQSELSPFGASLERGEV